MTVDDRATEIIELLGKWVADGKSVCATCGQEQCEDEEKCDLFWRLDQFWYLDFGDRHDDEEGPYEQYEKEFDR